MLFTPERVGQFPMETGTPRWTALLGQRDLPHDASASWPTCHWWHAGHIGSLPVQCHRWHAEHSRAKLGAMLLEC